MRAERDRWARACEEGRAFFAERGGRREGMLVMGEIDGAPYLDQLSVRMDAMRRGIGRALLAHAIAWAGPRGLWLNTYDHLSWNRPFYERAGFAVVAEEAWGPEMRAVVAEQRRSLPDPRRHAPPGVTTTPLR